MYQISETIRVVRTLMLEAESEIPETLLFKTSSSSSPLTIQIGGLAVVTNKLNGYERCRFIVTRHHDGVEPRSGSFTSLKMSQTLA